MAIVRVQFRDPVPNIGEGWSREKHGRTGELVEKGAWLIATSRDGGAQKGQRVRIPMSNVVSITEDDVIEVVK